MTAQSHQTMVIAITGPLVPDELVRSLTGLATEPAAFALTLLLVGPVAVPPYPPPVAAAISPVAPVAHPPRW
jgi:hypothetical protein